MRVAVVTAPSTRDRVVALHEDVKLTKAAILYADQVELVSPGAEMLGAFATIAEGGVSALLDVLEASDPETIGYLFGDSEMPADWIQTARRLVAMDDHDWTAVQELTGLDTTDLRRASTGVKEQMATVTTELEASLELMVEKSGARELLPALDSGLVTISPVLTSSGHFQEGFAEHYAEMLAKLLKSRDVHVILDQRMADLARAMIAEGVVRPGYMAQRQASSALLGSGLIARLPTFDVAPMDELLQLRTDLTEPLGRYRNVVLTLSGLMAAGPFDVEREAAVDSLYRSEVLPALDDLRDNFAEHGLVRDVARHLSRSVGSLVTAVSGSALVVGFAHVSDLDAWITNGLTALPTAGLLADALIGGALEGSRSRKALERSDLFYLYAIDSAPGRK